METEKAFENDFTRCEDFLSAEGLVAIRKPTEESTAHIIGSKFYRQTHSQMEEKEVEASMANFRETLDKKRATRICDLMQAKWDDQLNASLTDKLKGKYVQHMGRSVDGKVALSPEESMFLLENGCIEIMNGDSPMSTEEGFAVMLKRNLGVEKYKVYSHLAQLGFVVVSHQRELNITRYEKNMNLDKHHVKKRKATSTEIEEPTKKRLTFTGALLEEIKQINQQKDLEISLEDDDSVTECPSMAEASNITLNSKPSEEVKESEKENLTVQCMESCADDRIWNSKEVENVDSNSVCSLRDEASNSVSGKTLNAESGNDLQMDNQPLQECDMDILVEENVDKRNWESKELENVDSNSVCSVRDEASNSVRGKTLNTESGNEVQMNHQTIQECDMDIIVEENVDKGNWESIVMGNMDSNSVCSVRDEVYNSVSGKTLNTESCNDIQMDHQPVQECEVGDVGKGQNRSDNSLSCSELFPFNELTSTAEHPFANRLPSSSESTPVNESPSTSELTRIKKLPSTSEMTPINELTSTSEVTPIKELTSASKSIPFEELPSTIKELPSSSESSHVSELPSHDKPLPINELPPNSKAPTDWLPACIGEFSPFKELSSHGESPLINELPPNSKATVIELPSNSETVSVKELTSSESPPIELSSTSDLPSFNELTSTNASPPIDELTSICKSPPVNDLNSANELQPIDKLNYISKQPPVNDLSSTNKLQPIDKLVSTSKLPPVNKQPSTTELQPIDELDSISKQSPVNEQSSTNKLPSISELLSTGGLPRVNDLTSTKELPSSSGLLPTIDLSSDSQLPFNNKTPTTSELQVTVETESGKQKHDRENRRNSMSTSEKSDIEVMDVDSQSNDISDTSREAVDQQRNTFGDSIHFLAASGNSVIGTIESNENTDLDVLSCSSPKSEESDVLSLEPNSEDSFPRNDYETFEDPKNNYEEEDVTLLEVTKKETKPLAVIDLLSEEEESSSHDSDDSDDEISVVEVRSAPSGSKNTQSASLNPKKLCKKEEGSSSVAPNSNAAPVSLPKVQFPLLSRKNVICVARPPLHFLPNNVRPAKEAYVLEIKPKIDDQQRVWSSYRQMQDYQQMLRLRRQNPDFPGSREQISRPFDGPLQQHPLNRPLPDAPGPNLNNFGHPVDVNRNPVSYSSIYPMPHTSQINSVVSIRQQNMSMVENHNFPPLFPPNVPLPNLPPGMPPAHVLDQVQRTAYSVATNMLSYMLNQQQQRNDHPRFPPHMNSYNSYSSVNGQSSGMHPNDVPPFFSNGMPPDFMHNDRRFFRRKRHTGKPFPCSFKGASNKRSWDEVKASMNIVSEDAVSDGTRDSNVPASDGSDIEEVPITPTETLWDSPGVNPLVKSGVKHEKSFVLNTLQVTQMAKLTKSNLNDRCFQESSSLEVSFDVYLPGFNYRKTSPGIPKHRIIVVKATDPVPRYSELAFVQRKLNDGAFLQVAFVDNGDVSFVSFNSISLPMLIPYES